MEWGENLVYSQVIILIHLVQSLTCNNIFTDDFNVVVSVGSGLFVEDAEGVQQLMDRLPDGTEASF